MKYGLISLLIIFNAYSVCDSLNQSNITIFSKALNCKLIETNEHLHICFDGDIMSKARESMNSKSTIEGLFLFKGRAEEIKTSFSTFGFETEMYNSEPIYSKLFSGVEISLDSWGKDQLVKGDKVIANCKRYLVNPEPKTIDEKYSYFINKKDWNTLAKIMKNEPFVEFTQFEFFKAPTLLYLIRVVAPLSLIELALAKTADLRYEDDDYGNIVSVLSRNLIRFDLADQKRILSLIDKLLLQGLSPNTINIFQKSPLSLLEQTVELHQKNLDPAEVENIKSLQKLLIKYGALSTSELKN